MKEKLKQFKTFFEQHKRASYIGLAALLILIGGWIVYASSRGDDAVARTDPANNAQDSEPVVEFVPSPLTGLSVEKALAERPVTAVVIENSPDARPQSGLRDAGMVFEAVAEGGITRFVALYQEGIPELIGPVRSLRPFFNDVAATFEAAIAHVGGSPQALGEVGALGIRDLDQFANSGSYFRSSDRFAPHNMYTRGSLLDALQGAKGFATSTYTPLARKAEAQLEIPDVNVVNVTVSSFLYNSSYIFNQADNTYVRSEGGELHLDRESGQPISPKVVVVLRAPHSQSGQYTLINFVGSGEALVFQDGTVATGTWNKASRTGPLELKKADGTPLELNAGQTWITMVRPDAAVTFSP